MGWTIYVCPNNKMQKIFFTKGVNSLKITVEVSDKSSTAKPNIRVHNHYNYNDCVELEMNGERQIINGKELIYAIQCCIGCNIKEL